MKQDPNYLIFVIDIHLWFTYLLSPSLKTGFSFLSSCFVVCWRRNQVGCPISFSQPGFCILTILFILCIVVDCLYFQRQKLALKNHLVSPSLYVEISSSLWTSEAHSTVYCTVDSTVGGQFSWIWNPWFLLFFPSFTLNVLLYCVLTKIVIKKNLIIFWFSFPYLWLGVF